MKNASKLERTAGVSSEEIVKIRRSLHATQAQLSRILGVHDVTVSKWERGMLRPTPHQEALLRAARRATRIDPGVGAAVVRDLADGGVGLALFRLLSAAFGPQDRRCASCPADGEICPIDDAAESIQGEA